MFKGLVIDGKGIMGWCHGEETPRQVISDRGYISPRLFDMLFEDGIHLVTGIKFNKFIMNMVVVLAAYYLNTNNTLIFHFTIVRV